MCWKPPKELIEAKWDKHMWRTFGQWQLRAEQFPRPEQRISTVCPDSVLFLWSVLSLSNLYVFKAVFRLIGLLYKPLRVVLIVLRLNYTLILCSLHFYYFPSMILVSLHFCKNNVNFLVWSTLHNDIRKNIYVYNEYVYLRITEQIKPPCFPRVINAKILYFITFQF